MKQPLWRTHCTCGANTDEATSGEDRNRAWMRAAYRMLHTVGPIKLWLWRRLLIGITLQLELSAQHTLDGCVLGFGLFPRKPFFCVWVRFNYLGPLFLYFNNNWAVSQSLCCLYHLIYLKWMPVSFYDMEQQKWCSLSCPKCNISDNMLHLSATLAQMMMWYCAQLRK